MGGTRTRTRAAGWEYMAQPKNSQGSTRLNIDTTCELIKGVKLIAELHNVTSAPDEIRYEYDPRYPTYLRNEGWEATLGLRWDL